MTESIKVIFLDRDGVICDNSEHYYITSPEQFKLNPGVIEALSELKKRGYRFVVITNQGGISQGVNTHENVALIHEHMRKLLADKEIELDEIYYCPHHGDNEACLCRKPLPLMLEKAIARFRIDREKSWFIGDSERDVEAGMAAGVKTISIASNSDVRNILSLIID
jgi:D-glycero-D-manno-heptose 1,7-bisphosphate phosphatase